ncbi:TlpA disulfide reductase family protein [Saccharospirillum mangrovi]|uniref:TlpA disulfide reductase family protein n=1 Tax=Saccharospirillum mangrovi TaxID=2161747 RepID=UPI000D360050|nr:TlpA disulfide reductase family protein [Saccharospirillum mangrovi]
MKAISLLFLTALLSATAARAERQFEAVDAEPWPVASPLRALPDDSREFNAQGVPMLVNLWAVWCIPCRDELPSLNALRERIPADQLRMVALNYGDTPANVETFVARVPIDFDIWLDIDTSVSRQLPMRGLPTTFLIDAQGQLRYRLEGITDWHSDAMVGQLNGLLDTLDPASP